MGDVNRMGTPDPAPFGRDRKSLVDLRAWVKPLFQAHSLLSFFFLGRGLLPDMGMLRGDLLSWKMNQKVG